MWALYTTFDDVLGLPDFPSKFATRLVELSGLAEFLPPIVFQVGALVILIGLPILWIASYWWGTIVRVWNQLPHPVLLHPNQVVVMRGDVESKDRALTDAELKIRMVLDDAQERVKADQQLLARRDAVITDLQSRRASAERNLAKCMETESELRIELQRAVDLRAQAAVTFNARERQLLGEIQDIRGLQDRCADELRTLQQLQEPKLAIVFEETDRPRYVENRTSAADENVAICYIRVAVENLSDATVEGVRVTLASCSLSNPYVRLGQIFRLANDEPPSQKSQGFTLGPRAREFVDIVMFEGRIHGRPPSADSDQAARSGIYLCYAASTIGGPLRVQIDSLRLTLSAESNNSPRVESTFAFITRWPRAGQAPFVMYCPKE